VTPRFDVYAILDPSSLPDPDHWEEATAAVLSAGVGVVQLRDKQASAAELVHRARRLTELCDAHGALCVVNDRLDVALAAGAHGVHLGPHDIPIADARRVAPALLIGASAGSPERAAQLVSEGADYLGVGALYDARASKANASSPRGPDLVREVHEVVDVPVVGIGGITAERIPEVRAAGASGVAVIRAIFAQSDPGAAASTLLHAWASGHMDG